MHLLLSLHTFSANIVFYFSFLCLYILLILLQITYYSISTHRARHICFILKLNLIIVTKIFITFFFHLYFCSFWFQSNHFILFWAIQLLSKFQRIDRLDKVPIKAKWRRFIGGRLSVVLLPKRQKLKKK